jgi:hypothetical protein
MDVMMDRRMGGPPPNHSCKFQEFKSSDPNCRKINPNCRKISPRMRNAGAIGARWPLRCAAETSPCRRRAAWRRGGPARAGPAWRAAGRPRRRWTGGGGEGRRRPGLPLCPRQCDTPCSPCTTMMARHARACMHALVVAHVRRSPPPHPFPPRCTCTPTDCLSMQAPVASSSARAEFDDFVDYIHATQAGLNLAS